MATVTITNADIKMLRETRGREKVQLRDSVSPLILTTCKYHISCAIHVQTDGKRRYRVFRKLNYYSPAPTANELRYLACVEKETLLSGGPIEHVKQPDMAHMIIRRWEAGRGNYNDSIRRAISNDPVLVTLSHEDIIKQDKIIGRWNKLIEEKPVMANRMRTALIAAAKDNDMPDMERVFRKLPKAKETPRTEVLNDDEYERLVDVVSNKDNIQIKIVWLMVAKVGMRYGQAAALRWMDFSEDVSSVSYYCEKRKAKVWLPVPDEVKAAVLLARLMPNFESNKLIWPVGAKSATVRYSVWETTAAAANLRKHLRPHDVRRTVGLRISKKHGIDKAAKLLGHADIRTTHNVYSPMMVDDLKALID